MTERKLRLRLVGSALRKENPRDWDLVLFIPDEIFEQLYMKPERFKEEGLTGNWSEERWIWASDSIDIGHMIANLSDKNIDFKILPCSMEY